VLFTVYSPNYVPSGTWLALMWYCVTMFLLEQKTVKVSHLSFTVI